METTSTNNHQPALAIHLTLAMLPLMMSKAALQPLKDGLKSWNIHSPASLPQPMQMLYQDLCKINQDQKLAKAVTIEAETRLYNLLLAVDKYKNFNFTRDISEPEYVLKIGNARLLDFGGKENGRVIFLIPSLINRYYILDLTKKLSFARHLKDEGFRVFIVD
jgi:polyhydroxyalkanoate synthase subunit PhaC